MEPNATSYLGDRNLDRGIRSNYVCHRCRIRAYPNRPSGPTRNCPDCYAGFTDSTPQSLEPADDRLTHGIQGQHQLSREASSPQVPSDDSFDVSSVSDLLQQMQLHDDNPNNDRILIIGPEPTLSYNFESAETDVLEWDRILSWYFENESAFFAPHAAGLPEGKIQSIPVSLLKSKDVIDKEPTCSICIDDFELMEEVKNLPCKHFFHKECIDTWLKMRASCPVCRKTVKVDDHIRSFDVRAPDPVENFWEASNIFSGESLHRNDHTYPANEVPGASSAPPSIGRTISGSSRIPLRNRWDLNDTAIHDDEQNSCDQSSCWHFPNTNRGEYAVHESQPVERVSCGHAQHTQNQRTQSGHLPLERRGLHGSTFSSLNDYSGNGTFMPGLPSCMQDGFVPDVRSSSDITENSPFQPSGNQHQQRNAGTSLHQQRNSSGSFFDDSSGRYSLSNSSSLEDLSSIVPILPPIVF